MRPRPPDAILNDFMKFAIAEAHILSLCVFSVRVRPDQPVGTLHADAAAAFYALVRERLICGCNWNLLCTISALASSALSGSRANALLCALHVESIHKFTQVQLACVPCLPLETYICV